MKAVKCDFRGLAMGDSWISPVDSVLTWGPYLYSTVSSSQMVIGNLIITQTGYTNDNM